MNIVIIGLSITSSWGNDHASTYRSLIKGLHLRCHQVHFLERDVPRFAEHRDFTYSEFCQISLYSSLKDLQEKFTQQIRNADLVILGSYVREGVDVGNWIIRTATGIKAFYDLDTPVTLTKLRNKDYEYIHPRLIALFDLYLSCAGGKVPEIFKREFGSPHAKPLYCSVDPDLYCKEQLRTKWDLGYIGTCSTDRQSPLTELMLKAAVKLPEFRFIVAGPQFPDAVNWPVNVERVGHIPPAASRYFYNQQRFTLNITRKDTISTGSSPSVRLFEAAACGVPVISDYWEGLDDFFKTGSEILIAQTGIDTMEYLLHTTETQRLRIGENARRRILSSHTGEIRAVELELYVMAVQLKTMYMPIGQQLGNSRPSPT